MKKKSSSKTVSNNSSKTSHKNVTKVKSKSSKDVKNKKIETGNKNFTKHEHHPIFREEKTIGQKAADFIANFGGSWTFVISLIVILLAWMAINAFILTQKPFDPYPFILLNLVLSTLAAFQAPIILMAQNRQTQRDRIDAKYDHAINRKSERENRKMMRDLAILKRHLLDVKRKV